LDTWFSSWLWPFSTLGWPDENAADLKRFYPTNTLVTGPDIIFFWVARMIMAGLYFKDEVPFANVYLHGTVRTDTGQKMSKSLGNIIDPLEIIQDIGADALRFSIIMLTASGQDAHLSEEKFELGRNFTNKIWNASRFALLKLEDFETASALAEQPDTLGPVDRWILSRLQKLIQDVDQFLEAYRFNDAALSIYHFFWHDFCDWYLELIKPILISGSAEEQRKTKAVLLHVIETSLRCLHPFMPYISEELWQKFKGYYQDGDQLPASIMIADWPLAQKELINEESEQLIELLQQSVVAVRDLRAKFNIPPGKKLDVIIKAKDAAVSERLERLSDRFSELARLEKIEIVTEYTRTRERIGHVGSDMEIFVLAAGAVDLSKERDKLANKIEETKGHIKNVEGRLNNEKFVSSAPAAVVERDRAKCDELHTLLANLEENRALFS